jgi:hypothetical protein
MPFVVIVILMMLCALAAIILFLTAVEDRAFEGTGLLGFLFFIGTEIILITLIVLGFMWLNAASNNEELGWETFHNIVVDVRNGEDVKCVKIRYNSSIEFVNMNGKFRHVIKEGTFVRRYANKHWSCNVYTIDPTVYYELIGPKHERYAEVKKKMNKDVTTQPSN